MPKRASGGTALAFFWVCSLWSVSAWSWIETAVRAHSARVEVAEDGSATVRHELTLKVRGGPMKSLEIGGIGTEVEPLPDATVRRAVEGSSGMWPLSSASMEDGALRLKIGAERGIRGGSYIFSFGYQVDLASAGLIRPTSDGVVVEWVGPRLSSGVDSARVTFVLPRSPSEPRVFQSADDLEANVLLGEVRRGSEQDEIDLVRAHLATGEPAVWRVLTEAPALAGLSTSDAVPLEPDSSSSQTRVSTSRVAEEGWTPRRLFFVGLVGLLCGLLLSWKSSVLQRSASMTRARLLPLLPLPGVARAAMGSLAMGSYVACVFGQQLWGALVALTLALSSGTHLLPVRRSTPRGPGRWELISDAASEPPPLPGAWLDSRSVRGASLLLLLLGSLVVFAVRVLPESNYLALMSLLGGLVLCPVFFTGSRRDFPRSPRAQAEPWRRSLARAIDPQLAQLELWGRRACVASSSDGTTAVRGEVDECRVRVVPSAVPPGLKACELTLEEAAGAHVLPCILLRVVADSPAQASLPADVAWRRGRSADERVALLRPAAPTVAQTNRLLRSLLKTLRAARGQSSSVSSSGNCAVAAKGSMLSGEPLISHA